MKCFCASYDTVIVLNEVLYLTDIDGKKIWPLGRKKILTSKQPRPLTETSIGRLGLDRPARKVVAAMWLMRRLLSISCSARDAFASRSRRTSFAKRISFTTARI